MDVVDVVAGVALVGFSSSCMAWISLGSAFGDATDSLLER